MHQAKLDYKEELYFNPLFDYYQFYEDRILTDCELTFKNDPSKDPIKAHIFVLSNASDVFRSIFTSQLVESQTGIVELQDSHCIIPYITKVIEFLYSGRLSFTDNDLMILYHIANTYGIKSLQDRIHIHLDNIICPDNIYTFANHCYQYELVRELTNKYDGLVKYFSKCFFQLKIADLTKALDVVTFCTILELVLTDPDYADRNIGPKQIINYLDEFVGDWECDDIEKKACANLFDRGNKDIRIELSRGKHTWLPKDF